MTKLQSSSMGSSHCSEEELYSFTHLFVHSVGQFSPICWGFPVQVLRWVLGHMAGARQGAREAEVWLGPLRPLPLPDMSFHLLSLGLSLPIWTSRGCSS